MKNYIVVPFHLAAKYQRLADSGYNPFTDMRPKEVIQCRRLMDQRARQDASLAKWNARDIDNTKD